MYEFGFAGVKVRVDPAGGPAGAGKFGRVHVSMPPTNPLSAEGAIVTADGARMKG